LCSENRQISSLEHALEFGAVSLTAVFLSMSNWISGLNAMVQDPATKGLPSYLTGDRAIRLGLLHRASILEKCKEDGLEGENNSHLRGIYSARNPCKRCYAYLVEIILLSQSLNAKDPKGKVFAPLSLAARFVPPQQQALD
jgi:hypothetical protein